MPLRKLIIMTIIFLVFLCTGACRSNLQTLSTQPPGIINTYAAQTWEAKESQSPSSGSAIPNTMSASPTLIPSPTLYATEPIQYTPTQPSGIPCNAAELVKHISIPPNTIISPGAGFTKTWRLKNIGLCSWDNAYSIIFTTGESMGGEKVQLFKTVPPGMTVDVSVDLLAPTEPGNHQGNWVLNSGTESFGIDSDMLTIEVNVIEMENNNIVYNFAKNYCDAYWENEQERLPCPGKEGRSTGFALLLTSPELETRKENEPTLWTHPRNATAGMIVGTYPPISIQNGDHFLSEIGCLAGYSQCNVTFQLGIKANDEPIVILDQWSELYDGDTTLVDQDLSNYAGKSVQIILKVWNNGLPDQASAFWLMPQIRFEPENEY